MQGLEVLGVQVDFLFALGRRIFFQAVYGQISRPASVELAVGVVELYECPARLLIDVDPIVLIGIDAIKQFRRDALDHQQFVQVRQRPVGRLIRRHKAQVEIRLGPVCTRRIVFVKPIQNRIDNLFVHARNKKQSLAR